MNKIVRKFYSGYTAYFWNTAYVSGRGSRTASVMKNFEKKVKKFKLTDNHGALIDTNGELYTWGDNNYG